MRFGPPSEIVTGVIPPDTDDCGPLPPALPARKPRYVIPGSHWNDPQWWQMPRTPTFFDSGFPVPRTPWPFESETRAPGTGLLAGPSPSPCPPPPCPPTPCPPTPWQARALPQRAPMRMLPAPMRRGR